MARSRMADLPAVQSLSEPSWMGGARLDDVPDDHVVKRASVPFVFRTGGLDGRGKKVRTLPAMVRHIDRHPEDGVFHLLNGTLAQWLEDQGAWDLAEWARTAARCADNDPRVAVEIFLVGANLARRPRLSVKPARLVIGPVVAGEVCESRLVVRKGRGRGYLFGTLHSSAPWLSVEPQSFSAGPHVAAVTVDTGTLPIGQRSGVGGFRELPQAEILIESSATSEPVAVPVSVRVVGIPSRLGRYVFRPMASALLAGLLGAAVGWCLARSGLRAPGWLPGGWATAIGLLWALSGAVRGLSLPLARSWLQGSTRGLLRTLAVAAALVPPLAGGFWYWLRAGPGLDTDPTARAAAWMLLGALAVAVVPATLLERRSPRRAHEKAVPEPRRPRRRRLSLRTVVVTVVLIAAIGLGGPWMARTWQRDDVQGAVSSARQWTGHQWARLKLAAQRLAEAILFGTIGLQEQVPAATCALAVGAAPAPAPLGQVEGWQCKQC